MLLLEWVFTTTSVAFYDPRGATYKKERVQISDPGLAWGVLGKMQSYIAGKVSSRVAREIYKIVYLL